MRWIPLGTALGIGILVLGCRGVNQAGCENGACPTRQVCDVPTHLCVQVVEDAPTIAISAPADDALLDGGSTELIGTVSSQHGPAMVEYALADAGGWLNLDAGTDGHFDLVVGLPSNNGTPFPIQVRATDSRGQQGYATVSPRVDNVAPEPVLSAADQSRTAGLTLRIDFGEPVAAKGSATISTLSPDAGEGTWSADHSAISYSGLANDTVYTATVASSAVVDGAGHLAGGASATFRTQARQPIDGDVIAPPGGTTGFLDFDATSDQDGVVTVAARTLNDYLVWGRFDPKTGGFIPAQTPFPGSAQTTSLVAEASAGTGPDAPRLNGFSVDHVISSVPTRSAYWLVEGGNVQSRVGGTYALVATASGAGEEPTSTTPGVGLVVDAGVPTYSRPPNPDATLGFAPRYVVGVQDDWEAVDQVGATLMAQRHVCAAVDGGSPACTFEPVAGLPTDLGSKANLSIARVPGRTLYVYDNQDGSARTEYCASCDADGGTSCPASGAQSPTKIGQYLRVAAEPHSQKVLGAWLTLTSPANIQLGERDLSQSCTGDWTVLGALGSSSPQFRPVMFGTRPGLLYVTGDDNIGVYIP